MGSPEKNFVIVNGLAFGEESKGNSVQAVARKLQAHTIWRSGGWQGGHHIEHDDGRSIALSHFGAGIFDGSETYLNHMVISPVELFEEAMQLQSLGIPDPLSTIAIDESCIATTPFHSGISRTREILRGAKKKGTIGKGVGEALKDAHDPALTIRAGEFSDRECVREKVKTIRKEKLKAAKKLLDEYEGTPPEEAFSEMSVLYDESVIDLVTDAFFCASELIPVVGQDHLEKVLKREGVIVNEVSHGTLHHPQYGFLPHVTQIDPTSRDVQSTVTKHEYNGNLLRLGIMRSYLTRHGAGPLVSYDSSLSQELTETHNNAANEWLGDFRVGYFDILALRYALAITGGKENFAGLIVSYMDVLTKRDSWGVVEGYEYYGGTDNLQEYFVRDKEGVIRDIKVFPDTDAEELRRHQYQLTRLLNECRPIVTTLSATEDKPLENVFLDYVTEKLSVPVVGTAYGPKVSDRHFSSQWDEIVNRVK